MMSFKKIKFAASVIKWQSSCRLIEMKGCRLLLVPKLKVGEMGLLQNAISNNPLVFFVEFDSVVYICNVQSNSLKIIMPLSESTICIGARGQHGRDACLSLSSTSASSWLAAPLISGGWPSVPFSGLLKAHSKGSDMSCTFSNMNVISVSTLSHHLPPAWCPSHCQRQATGEGRDPFHVRKGSHVEGDKQVLSRVLQSVVCNTQEEREASVGHWPTVLEPSANGVTSMGWSHFCFQFQILRQ